jgi:hypothetical protein
MSTATLPYEHLGEALATDYFGIRTRAGSSTRRSCR